MAKHGQQSDERQAKCCGVVEEGVARSREKRERRREKAQPWIVLKMTVGIALAIMGYAFYVYIGRLCVPMIRHDTGAIPGGRGTGIAFLVIFCFLAVMMLWTYAMVVFIGPGEARNFFIHFCQWAGLFCVWVFATMLANVIKAGPNPLVSIDPQEIVIIALAFMFIWFTVALLATHTHMILINQTTVETLNASRMKERESTVLGRLHAWNQCGAKRLTKRQWDEEWGRIGKEGNLWWLGDARKNWEAVMGDKWYQWFLPLGRTPGDGLTFPTNPRFDEEGRWRRRSEWPAELR
ncbi:palmitoyltransferase pfa5 [Steccherinum ochraceum]|uniref:Palmitoyltransferase pfa5 n=1 Tax=Steccherinum ochraceum TaxID=92696 RepID=A0A4V2MWV9_9APHY|nr:palmitoyltransferase pfa5 [Steccherinum ochraceum]